MEQHRVPVEAPTWKFKTRLHHCEIWEHNIHHAVVEAYPLQKYEPLHAKINRNKPHIVNSLGIVVDNRNSQPYLLIERIPNRFSQVFTLTQPQTLRILYAVFKGLDELQEMYGVIAINEGCICFNEAGKVKVWVNPDLSSLHPIFNLKEHSSSQSKILYNIRHVISLVQKKCFNSSFLKPLTKKLNENKISSYRQAADEILRIGEMLFVVVEEKQPISVKSTYPQPMPYKNKFQNQQCGTTKKNGNRDNEEVKAFRKQNMSGHCRKFSNHEPTAETNHRRYQSFFESQPAKKEPVHNLPTNLGLDLNKLAQSQAFQMLLPQIHKSAPLSPREDKKKSHTKNNSELRQNANKNKAPLFHKKHEVKSIFYETVKETIPQFDDSFSQNLKVDEKEIMVSGDFQTFGILQDLTESYHNKKKQKKTQSRWQKDDQINQMQGDHDYDFDIGQMDIQIQKRLEKRIKEDKKRTSIRASLQASEQKVQQKQSPKIKTLPYDQEKENYQYSFEPAFKREKSPHFYYIDQKYEQYIHKRQLGKKGVDGLGTPPKAGVRQRTQVGQGAVTAGYNSSKKNLHPNNSTVWKSPKQSYRLATDR